jgi:hypothetical protein
MESEAVSTGMDIVEWTADGVEAVGSLITAIFGSSGAWAALLPVIGLGIGFWVISRGIGFVRSLVSGF